MIIFHIDYGYSTTIFTEQPDSFVAPANAEPISPMLTPPPPPQITHLPSVPPAEPQPTDNIFADTSAGKDLDVTSIITKRLNAMRKLQENPLDSEAIKLMYRTQKDVSSNEESCAPSHVNSSHSFKLFIVLSLLFRCLHGLVRSLFLVNLLVALVLAFYQRKNLPLAFKPGPNELVSLFKTFFLFLDCKTILYFRKWNHLGIEMCKNGFTFERRVKNI